MVVVNGEKIRYGRGAGWPLGDPIPAEPKERHPKGAPSFNAHMLFMPQPRLIRWLGFLHAWHPLAHLSMRCWHTWATAVCSLAQVMTAPVGSVAGDVSFMGSRGGSGDERFVRLLAMQLSGKGSGAKPAPAAKAAVLHRLGLVEGDIAKVAPRCPRCTVVSTCPTTAPAMLPSISFRGASKHPQERAN